MSSRLQTRFLFVGPSGAGKTCLVERICHPAPGDIALDPESTVGIRLRRTARAVQGGVEVVVQLWDTAGQADFKTLSPAHLKKAHAVFVVFDADDPASFESAETAYQETKSAVRGDCTLVLVMNKADLDSSDQACVSPESGEIYAKQRGMMFFQTSAVAGDGVEDMFGRVLGRTLARMPHLLQTDDNRENDAANGAATVDGDREDPRRGGRGNQRTKRRGHGDNDDEGARQSRHPRSLASSNPFTTGDGSTPYGALTTVNNNRKPTADLTFGGNADSSSGANESAGAANGGHAQQSPPPAIDTSSPPQSPKDLLSHQHATQAHGNRPVRRKQQTPTPRRNSGGVVLVARDKNDAPGGDIHVGKDDEQYAATTAATANTSSSGGPAGINDHLSEGDGGGSGKDTVTVDAQAGKAAAISSSDGRRPGSSTRSRRQSATAPNAGLAECSLASCIPWLQPAARATRLGERVLDPVKLEKVATRIHSALPPRRFLQYFLKVLERGIPICKYARRNGRQSTRVMWLDMDMQRVLVSRHRDDPPMETKGFFVGDVSEVRKGVSTVGLLQARPAPDNDTSMAIVTTERVWDVSMVTDDPLVRDFVCFGFRVMAERFISNKVKTSRGKYPTPRALLIAYLRGTGPFEAAAALAREAGAGGRRVGRHDDPVMGAGIGGGPPSPTASSLFSGGTADSFFSLNAPSVISAGTTLDRKRDPLMNLSEEAIVEQLRLDLHNSVGILLHTDNGLVSGNLRISNFGGGIADDRVFVEITDQTHMAAPSGLSSLRHIQLDEDNEVVDLDAPGVDVSDISEIRPGAMAYRFMITDITPERSKRCISIVGSEDTLSFEAPSSETRDILVMQLQTLLYMARPETRTYTQLQAEALQIEQAIAEQQQQEVNDGFST